VYKSAYDPKASISVMTFLDPQYYDDDSWVDARVQSDPTWDREKEIYLIISQELIATVDLVEMATPWLTDA
jgi:hypothetical protein